MATNLKLKKKCHVVPPEWLNVGQFVQPSSRRITNTEQSYDSRVFAREALARDVVPRVQRDAVPVRRGIEGVVGRVSYPNSSAHNATQTLIKNLTMVHRASDDFQNPDKIRSLLKDIREARQAKSRDGLSQLDHSELSVRLSWSLRKLLFGTDRKKTVVAKLMCDGDQRNPPVLRPRHGRAHTAGQRSRGAAGGAAIANLLLLGEKRINGIVRVVPTIGGNSPVMYMYTKHTRHKQHCQSK